MAANTNSNSSKKAANTSKTAHVMNLISKNRENSAPDAAGAEAAAAAEAGARQVSAPAAPPVISSLSSDAAVSAQIKSALEDVLENEPARTPPAAPEPPAPVVEAAPEPVPEPAAPAPEPVPEPVAEQAPAAPDDAADNSLEFTYVNVMQVLVEEKAEKYVKMFGTCGCDRCMADIQALALNNLPPKYVVMDRRDTIPRLTFYEGKYSSDITAQILQACKTVMNRPHHNR